MIRKFPLSAALLTVIAGSALAQETPLSAIDWLSRSVTPQTGTPQELGTGPLVTPEGAETPSINVTPLDSTSPDVVGLLPTAVTGLPQTLWAKSDESTLVTLVNAERGEGLPISQELLRMLMLAEAAAPLGAGDEGALFLARVDKLLDLGMLQEAQALLEAADPESPALFRRWFDISLLTGTEDAACKFMREAPDVEPTYPARIFCTARGGDWNAAALVLNTGIALGDITGTDEAILTRFLDDGGDHSIPLTVPERISPLIFRIFEAIGEALPTAQLPTAFAQADLRDVNSWRNRMEAAERLARHSAVDDNILQALYVEKTPAASGGIWDRAEAFQTFDDAITAGDANAVSAALPAVWSAMTDARTEVPFARLYTDQLQSLTLEKDAATLAFRVALLSPKYEQAANARIPLDLSETFLIAVAKGDVSQTVASGSKEQAVAAAFGTATLPQATSDLLQQGKLGELLLRALATFDSGLNGDPAAITEAIATFRAVGLEDYARRAALQYLLLDRST